MKRISAAALAAFTLCAAAPPAGAIEQPKYQVRTAARDFEIRTYEPYVVAEVVERGDQNQSVQAGFRKLAGYIFGGNAGGAKIAMTSPVAQAPRTLIRSVEASVVGHEPRLTRYGDGRLARSASVWSDIWPSSVTPMSFQADAARPRWD